MSTVVVEDQMDVKPWRQPPPQSCRGTCETQSSDGAG
jgi:hypothetical protein